MSPQKHALSNAPRVVHSDPPIDTKHRKGYNSEHHSNRHLKLLLGNACHSSLLNRTCVSVNSRLRHTHRSRASSSCWWCTSKWKFVLSAAVYALEEPPCCASPVPVVHTSRRFRCVAHLGIERTTKRAQLYMRTHICKSKYDCRQTGLDGINVLTQII
jgi:hypothetical protein